MLMDKQKHNITKITGRFNSTYGITHITAPSLRILVLFFLLALQPIVTLYFAASSEAIASSRTRFLDDTQRRATVGRTPLDE